MLDHGIEIAMDQTRSSALRRWVLPTTLVVVCLAVLGVVLWPPLTLCYAIGLCNPRALYTSIFPLRYVKTTTIELRHGDKTLKSVTVNHCAVTDMTRTLALRHGVTRQGEPNWFRLQSGAIVVAPDLGRCEWMNGGVRPPYGQALGQDYVAQRLWAAKQVGRNQTYVFDAPDPKRVEFYDTAALFAPQERDLRLSNARVDVERWPIWGVGVKAPTVRLRDEVLPVPSTGVMSNDPIFSGFQAEVRAYPPEIYCERFERRRVGGWVVLEQRDGCGGSEPACENAPPSGPVSTPAPRDRPCRRLLGYLVAHPDADQSRIDYRLDDLSASHKGTLFRTAWPKGHDRSRPNVPTRICIEGACFASPEARERLRLFSLETGLLIEVTPRSTTRQSILESGS